MGSFNSNENIHKKEDGPYYVERCLLIGSHVLEKSLCSPQTGQNNFSGWHKFETRSNQYNFDFQWAKIRNKKRYDT